MNFFGFRMYNSQDGIVYIVGSSYCCVFRQIHIKPPISFCKPSA